MKYLIIHVTDACVLTMRDANIEKKDENKVKMKTKTTRDGRNVWEYRVPDRLPDEVLKNPVRVNNVSNMLHVMCGLPPVPSMRRSIFKRVPLIHDLAKSHCFIEYERDPELVSETTSISSNVKCCFDSKRHCKTVICGKTMSGHYTWNYLRKRFSANEMWLFDKMLKLFGDVVGTDDVIRDYTFPKFMEEYMKHKGDERVIKFREKYDAEFKKKNSVLGGAFLLKGTYYDMLFNWSLKNTSFNTTHTQPTPVLIYRSPDLRRAAHKFTLLIEIDDEHSKVLEWMRNYGRIPTILERGCVDNVEVKSYIPDAKRENFVQILESIDACNKFNNS